MTQIKFVMEEGPITGMTYDGYMKIRISSARTVNFHVMLAEDNGSERLIMSTDISKKSKDVTEIPHVLRDALVKMFIADQKKESVWMSIEVLLVFGINYKKYLK